MQFAIMRVRDDVERIVSADEYQAVQKYEDGIIEVRLADDRNDFKVVYGAYLAQPGTHSFQAMKDLISYKGYGICIIRDKECILSELCDIHLHDPVDRGVSFYIPFAALFYTPVEIENESHFSQPFFLQYRNLSPTDNIFNRPGIHAVTAQEKRTKELNLLIKTSFLLLPSVVLALYYYP